MKSWLLVFGCLVLLFFGCSDKPAKEKSDLVNFHFIDNEKSEGLLIGEKINLLNTDLSIKKDISNYNERFIKIISVSDSLYSNNSNDYCESFKYVKIKIDSIEGIVDGRYVFYPEKNIRDNSISVFDKSQLRIIQTTFYGTGFQDEDGLTFCSPPIMPSIIIDYQNNFKGIGVIDGKYFELSANDAFIDKILDSEIINDSTYIFNINREFQEGKKMLLYRLSYNKLKGRFDISLESESKIEY